MPNVIRPEPVEVTTLDFMRSRLLLIRGGDEYWFDNKGRVVMFEPDFATCEQPLNCVVPRIGNASEGNSAHRRWELLTNVGYVFEYHGKTPAAAAARYEADIVKAVGFEWIINAFTPSSSPTPAQLPGRICFEVIRTVKEPGDPIAGRMYGQVDYKVVFETDWLDNSRV